MNLNLNNMKKLWMRFRLARHAKERGNPALRQSLNQSSFVASALKEAAHAAKQARYLGTSASESPAEKA